MDKRVESQQIPNSGQMDCCSHEGRAKVGRSAGLEELNAGLGQQEAFLLRAFVYV